MNLKRLSILSVLLIAGTAAFFPLKAAFAPKEKQEFQKLIHEYLVENPEVIKEALQALQKKETTELEQATVKTIIEKHDSIFKSTSPAFEPENSKVTLVEFFDYQCQYCKKMRSVVDSVVDKNTDLRVVYKDLPILGGHSVTAAKAALASHKQNKYLVFHEALMTNQAKLDETKIFELAVKVDLNLEQLKLDMESPEVMTGLQENMQLAQQIGIRGIPAIIIAPNTQDAAKPPVFIPGSTTEDKLQKAIDNSRI